MFETEFEVCPHADRKVQIFAEYPNQLEAQQINSRNSIATTLIAFEHGTNDQPAEVEDAGGLENQAFIVQECSSSRFMAIRVLTSVDGHDDQPRMLIGCLDLNTILLGPLFGAFRVCAGCSTYNVYLYSVLCYH